MSEFDDIILKMKTLVVFRNLKTDPVISCFMTTLEHIVREEPISAAEEYCAFIGLLYERTDSLTEYVLRTMMEDDNIYVRRKCSGEAGGLLDACLASELSILQELAMIPCFEVTDSMPEGLFLPEYKTYWVDFGTIYADRIRYLGQVGYGIYSRYYVFMVRDGQLVPVPEPDRIRLDQLHDYERERAEVVANTKALLAGKPANNVLLYGDCGTGKSSTVKAVANEFSYNGLRLIELKKKQLHEIPTIVEEISGNPLKFIIFIDDLSFTEDDSDYAALKAILEGSVASTASNLVVYATSNRRHLVRETFSSRKGDEVHFRDTMQEMLSLSDRFGLTVTFEKPDKALYLDIVRKLARDHQLELGGEELELRAEQFALGKGGRSPRVAKQFVEYVKGCVE